MDFDEDFECEDFDTGKVIDKVSNGEKTDYFVLSTSNGIYCTDGTFICDANDPDYQDKIDEYKDSWLEVNWTQSDWAEYYGCDEDEVDDVMDDDMGDW
ncbi:MAG: hypothetical protein J6Y78_09180 [Paludibacteraceae bacterium]|nr:hypothetical protein [Paludibacteraceae bacterium]